MLLGPFEDKTYQEVKIASIQCNRLPRRLAKCGQSVSLGFHKLGNCLNRLSHPIVGEIEYNSHVS